MIDIAALLKSLNISKKQLELIFSFGFRHICIPGAARGGKTYGSLLLMNIMIALLRIIWFKLRRNKIAVICQTRQTFERNILHTLKGQIGEENIDMTNFAMKGYCKIMGMEIHFISARNSDFIRRIRGAEFALIYIDEITLLPKRFYDYILTRCVQKGITIISTTNPDHPNHYVKTDIIDRAKDDDSIAVFEFTLDDNPTLSEEEKEAFRNSISDPLVYDRYILGKWVAAEGAIYHLGEMQICNHLPFTPTTYIAGIDDGHMNPFAGVLVAMRETPELPSLVVTEEIYFDGREQMVQHSPAENAELVHKHWHKYMNNLMLYVDPSASVLIMELRRLGFKVISATNDVQQGIHTVSNFLANGELCIHQNCTKTIKEMSAYRWNEAHALKTGNELPLKEGDHLPDALRYALHTRFSKCDYFSRGSTSDTDPNEGEISQWIRRRRRRKGWSQASGMSSILE